VPSPPEPVFFVDRSLGSVDVPAGLRAAGATIEIHDDHFPQTQADVAWLPTVGGAGWVVLTKDRRIRTRKLEAQALMDAGVGPFVLTAGDVTGAEMAEALVKALPRMRRMAAKLVRPFIATVSRSGDVTLQLGGARKGAVRRDG
jgi:hypothetical protein